MELINIYGGCGYAKMVIEAVESIAHGRINFVFDENPDLSKVLGHRVYSPLDEKKLTASPVVIAIGENGIRKKIAGLLSDNFAEAVIHNTAILSPTSELGQGSVVLAGAVINAAAVIGKHVIINSGAIVEHDCLLQDFVHISPKAALAGGVQVGEGTLIGPGAVVIPGIKIGRWCTIGAGAVIIDDIPDYSTVGGNPGRIIDKVTLGNR